MWKLVRIGSYALSLLVLMLSVAVCSSDILSSNKPGFIWGFATFIGILFYASYLIWEFSENVKNENLPEIEIIVKNEEP